MAELDLNDPKHVADLLRFALPDFDDHTPEVVESHIEALHKSDHPAFAHVGVGERVDPHEVVEPEPPIQQQPVQQQPLEQQPLDMGGEGQLIEPSEVAAELGRLPIYARRGWSEIDRHRAKGVHEVYDLGAKHTRGEPIHSAFTGRCQSVRVSLPRAKPPADSFIGTWTGTVEAKDHLAFSIDEIEQWYERSFGRRPTLARVDLITGARFRGRRFSPVSIYLGYRDAEGDPIFYFLEGGSASGRPQAMYCARQLDATINVQSGFQFTPFACRANWYEGGLALSQDKREPACVYLTAAQARDGRHQYLRLSVTYNRDTRLRRVVHPFELQVEAALRVLAIAEQAGCRLERGQGQVLSHSLGPLASALIPWDDRPRGVTSAAGRAQYCGCPK